MTSSQLQQLYSAFNFYYVLLPFIHTPRKQKIQWFRVCKRHITYGNNFDKRQKAGDDRRGNNVGYLLHLVANWPDNLN